MVPFSCNCNSWFNNHTTYNKSTIRKIYNHIIFQMKGERHFLHFHVIHSTQCCTFTHSLLMFELKKFHKYDTKTNKFYEEHF